MDFKNALTVQNNVVWHAGNDGHGSNLDADKLDGNEATAFVYKSSYDAYSILAADSNDLPAALTVGPSTFVGRKSTGGIVALTASEGRTVLGLNTTDSPTFAAVTAGFMTPSTMIIRQPGSSSEGGYATHVHLISTSGNPTQGTLAITLPKISTSTFSTFRITGYQYSNSNGRGAWSVMIGGYQYYNGSAYSWLQTSCNIYGPAPFDTVRLGYKTVASVITGQTILLGTTATNWVYPKIVVELMVYGGSSYTGYNAAWSHEFTQDESAYTILTTPTITMFEDTAGKFGFGTVAPAEKIHVGSGNIQVDHQYKFRTHNSTGSDVDLAWVDSNNISQYGTSGTNGWAIGPASQARIVSGGASGSRYISFEAGAGTQAMRIDASGNLCLGADSSTAKLHVVGTIAVSGGIRPISDGTAAIEIKNAAGTAFVTFDSTYKRVGIGTAPSTYVLNVYAADSGTAFYITKTNTSGTRYGHSFTTEITPATTSTATFVGLYPVTISGGAEVNVTKVIGIQPYVYFSRTATMTTMIGSNPVVNLAKGTYTTVYGELIETIYGGVDVNYQATVTKSIGLQINQPNVNIWSTVTTKYGIIVQNGAGNSGFGTEAPTAIVHAKQNLTSGGSAVLALEQLDNAGAFINLIATVASTYAINTDALGTYYGKFRVMVNGTAKWVALYN